MPLCDQVAAILNVWFGRIVADSDVTCAWSVLSHTKEGNQGENNGVAP